MAACEVCGNDYALSFQVVTAGESHTFDCFECAAHKLAPICEHCGCKVLGHGVQASGAFFCCAHCARMKGITAIVDNADHTGAGDPAEAEALFKRHSESPPQMLASEEGPRESWRGSGLAEDVHR